MPTIHPSTVTSTPPEGLSRAVNTKDAPTILPVAVGEILEARVGEKAGPSKYQLSLKNISVMAETDLPLKAGGKLLVRVEQLTPQILLRLVGQDASPAGKYDGYLKIFRGNPEALMEIFQKGLEVFDQQPFNRLFSGTVRNALENGIKIIDSLLCSSKSLANPLFLKDYAAKLGLRLEGDWLNFVRHGSKDLLPAESLKSVLLKIAGELTELLKEGGVLHPEELQKLTRLAKFTEASLKAIETQQMINVFSQENDNKYLLQIPLLFPEGIRTGEIFIELGENGPGGEAINKKCHVVMFLSMDKLGDMAVDAALSDNKIACVFKFTDSGAQEFFFPFLEGLGDVLRQIGYGSASLTAIVAEDLMVARQDCHREMFHEQDAINLFA